MNAVNVESGDKPFSSIPTNLGNFDLWMMAADLQKFGAPILCRLAWGACIGWTALMCLGLMTGEQPLTAMALIVAPYVICRALEGALK